MIKIKLMIISWYDHFLLIVWEDWIIEQVQRVSFTREVCSYICTCLTHKESIDAIVRVNNLWQLQFSILQQTSSISIFLLTQSRYLNTMELKGNHYHFNDTRILSLNPQGRWIWKTNITSLSTRNTSIIHECFQW